MILGYTSKKSMPKTIYTALIFLSLPCLCFASAKPLDVAINEIAWMGTKTSANDEWLELYNKSNQDINLEGWVLKANDGSPEIKLKGSILSLGYFLLERTDDNTLPAIKADQIYKGALGNNGEKLELYDNLGTLIDSVDCHSKWLAGDNSSKQTMERANNNWQTSENPGGTPKAENSAGAKITAQKTSPPVPVAITKQNPEEAKTEPKIEPKVELEEGENKTPAAKKENSGLAMASSLIIAVLSTTAILILNKQINKDGFA
ncbi:MAG: hypothetical protein COZ91_00660 [Candidatus Nealsonbacteria bacterium CG_4_8_14_3_um_filter_39_7]|uniref:LTD domain-containing protein n=1 Tax=Candidatus Nealsonbacteria bacterium CG23_combo_of_CG06-09_8_20_14_all_39_17 TaxID=1974722 RepID=A0A2G9YTR3_9BACT|nr:MAG: hypothetical protein COX37_03180 [Candidatus Nealsonbacteria bacterium CG23_combo_of_CG06-09_8_20_14_all_39_17]PIU44223.1 MAG: hypothetical protein COS96_00005 [Candidatus Nealsonbacteria bacterium CG07_land_8_20_14_0_80_39_13]PIW91652.1 MAG: hypothetical protein COZ91_00660 [Candidatus Nealsonbacteria bacterium CG_4_8_14_3_um_filter_39_7]